MFLKRSRVKKPGQEVFKSEFSEYIKAEELYIGTTVNVNGYLFHLLNADEYTLKYMENNTDKVNTLYTSWLPTFFSVGFSPSRAFSSASCHWCTLHIHTCGMNNESMWLGHRSYHRGPALVPSIYNLALHCPASQIPDPGGRQTQCWIKFPGFLLMPTMFVRRQCNNYRKERKSDDIHCVIQINWHKAAKEVMGRTDRNPKGSCSCWSCWSA